MMLRSPQNAHPPGGLALPLGCRLQGQTEHGGCEEPTRGCGGAGFLAPHLVQEPGSQPPTAFLGPVVRAKLVGDASSPLGSRPRNKDQSYEPKGPTPQGPSSPGL